MSMLPKRNHPAIMFDRTEQWVIDAVQWLKLGVEVVGAVAIGIGVVIAAYLFIRALVTHQSSDFTAIRLVLARYLALALEFQLGADILSTAIAPRWGQIGKLGAIAIIRTALNYFLSKELDTERAEVKKVNKLQTGAPSKE